jgi:phosphate starvation-inducible protein PhoH and related proteins
MKTISLESKTIAVLAGPLDENLRLIEDRFDVRVSARGSDVTIQAEGPGGPDREERVADLFVQLASLHSRGVALRRDDVKTAVGIMAREQSSTLSEHFLDSRLSPSARKTVVAKSPNQRHYIDAMRDNDLVFGVGPAGTGKTYLAVAMAITLLNEKRIQRILLCRPAVEAGEKLGFLPGDIAAKVDPYLRPLYDALHDMLEPERIEQLVERGTIEVAPLAFMRGRTLNDAFIILDEAQNTTPEQMKMFLTRIGLDSKAAVTGDVTQIDLPAQRTSGLVEAQEVVLGIPGIEIVRFDETDVVRHPLVQRIVVAYDERAARMKDARQNGSAEDRP